MHEKKWNGKAFDRVSVSSKHTARKWRLKMEKSNSDAIHFAIANATYEGLKEQQIHFTRETDLKLGNITLTAQMAYLLSDLDCHSINFFRLKTLEDLPARLLSQARCSKITFRFTGLAHRDDLGKIESWISQRRSEGLRTPKIQFFDSFYDLKGVCVLHPPENPRTIRIDKNGRDDFLKG